MMTEKNLTLFRLAGFEFLKDLISIKFVIASYVLYKMVPPTVGLLAPMQLAIATGIFGEVSPLRLKMSLQNIRAGKSLSALARKGAMLILDCMGSKAELVFEWYTALSTCTAVQSSDSCVLNLVVNHIWRTRY